MQKSLVFAGIGLVLGFLVGKVISSNPAEAPNPLESVVAQKDTEIASLTEKVSKLEADVEELKQAKLKTLDGLVDEIKRETDPGKKSTMIAKLGRFGLPAVPHLMEISTSGQAPQRLTALRTLGNVGTDSEIPALLDTFAKTSDPRVQSGILNAISSIRKHSTRRSGHLKDRTFHQYAPAMRRLMASPMKSDAMYILASFGDVQTASQITTMLLKAAPNDKLRFERSRPNELWQTDIFTFRLKKQNRTVYLIGFMDDHSRFMVPDARVIDSGDAAGYIDL